MAHTQAVMAVMQLWPGGGTHSGTGSYGSYGKVVAHTQAVMQLWQLWQLGQHTRLTPFYPAHEMRRLRSPVHKTL